jgi:hypothetical protein
MTIVRTRMLGRIALAVCALGTTAQADSEHRVRPVRPVSFAVSYAAHESKLAGLDERGSGPQLEAALGAGAWQAFAEGSVSRVSLGEDDMPFARGGRWRGGIGVRWIARSFELENFFAPELAFEVVTGMQHYDWDAGGTLQRGDIGVGVAWQGRFFARKQQFGLRMSARVMYAPAGRDHVAALCTGSCELPGATTNTGLTGVMGIVW